MDIKNYKLAVPVAALVLVAGAFAGGMVTEKAVSGATQTAAAGTAGTGPGGVGQGGQMAGGRPTIGIVTAASDATITVKDSLSSQLVTVTLTSSTTVTDAGSVVSAGEIKVGDAVAAFSTDQSGSTTGAAPTAITASRVEINPTTDNGVNGTEQAL